MITFSRVRLEQFDAAKIKLYEQLTPQNLHYLLHDKLSDRIIVIEASDEGTPVGLALGTYKKSYHYAEINSLFVKPEYRQKKIGTTLLKQLQNEVKKEKGILITSIFPLEDETSTIWQKILTNNKWDEHIPFMTRCTFYREYFNPPWLHTPIKFPPDYQEFLWSEITNDEKDQIKRMEKQGIVPDILSPFFEESRIEPLNSLGLRYKGEIVGWMITHRIDQNTIRYTSLFLIKDFRNQSYSTKLLLDAILLQKKSDVNIGVFELPLIQVSSSWKSFIKKRLIPYANEITHFVQSWLPLK